MAEGVACTEVLKEKEYVVFEKFEVILARAEFSREKMACNEVG